MAATPLTAAQKLQSVGGPSGRLQERPWPGDFCALGVKPFQQALHCDPAVARAEMSAAFSAVALPWT